MDNLDLPPWECIDPALTAERIMAVAVIIRDETDAKISVRDARDGPWNLGCDCYWWVLGRMHRSGHVAGGEHADWLFVESTPGSLDLQFRIGGPNGVESKIYRPDAPGQPGRTLKEQFDLFEMFREELGESLAPRPDPVVRFAVDKDKSGRVAAVRLVQLDVEGELLYRWTIWSADDAVFAIDDAPKPEGVELDEPIVTLPEDEEASKHADNKDKQEGA